MGLYDKFKTDEGLETKGVWLDYGDGERILIARAGGSNRAFVRAMERVARKYPSTEHLSEDVSRRILNEVYADTVVLGWQCIKGPDGADLPFNRENCVKLFEDLPELFREIREQSGRLAVFRATQLEADAKN